jgi:hypothetical protein
MITLWDQANPQRKKKTKNLGNIGLDDKTDLRKFDEENSFPRIS